MNSSTSSLISRLAVSLAGVLAGLSPAWLHAESERPEIRPGGVIKRIVLRDLNGDGRIDPVIVSVQNEPGGGRQRYVTFYSQGPSTPPDRNLFFKEDRRHAVPQDAVAFALGDFLGRGESQLIYLTGKSVTVVGARGESPIRLLENQRFFIDVPVGGDLPYWDLVSDVDGDGKDDLILADPRAYLIYLQRGDRRLVQHGRVEVDFGFVTQATSAIGGGAGRGRESAEGFRSRSIRTGRTIARLALADTNADARLDLLAMKDGRVLVFPQSDEGRFDARPSFDFRLGARQRGRAGEDSGSTIAHGDVNMDGRVDFVTARIEAKDLLTRLRLYLWSESGIKRSPSQIIKVKGLGGAPTLIDVNGDGYLDLCYLTLRADLILSLRRSSIEELAGTYYLFLFRPEEGIFSTKPDIKHDLSMALTSDMESNQSDSFISFEGDFNADGIRDLIVFENKGELAIFACRARSNDPMKLKLDSRPMHVFTIELPLDIEVVDLDGDAKSDIVLRYKDRLEVLRP